MGVWQPIEPFPDDIDRDYFGAWLSGFVDGEGCFTCDWDKSHHIGQLQFRIELRHDDKLILERIRSFLRCGRMGTRIHNASNTQPSVWFCVRPIEELKRIVVPNFEKYPLLAKKHRDFETWKLAVQLMYRIHQKPRFGNGGRGHLSLWTEKDRHEFQSIRAFLSNQRQCGSVVSEPPKTVRAESQCLPGFE